MRATLAAALLFVLAACTSGVEAPIRTDRSAYIVGSGQFGPELKIVSTLRAPADRAVRIANCNGAITPGLQRRVNDAWVDAWIAATDACASAPIVIPAGGTHTAELLIRPGAGAVTYPRPNPDALESGTYRVVWHGTDIPLEQRVSAPFTIEAPAIAAPPSTPPVPSTPPPQMPARRVASANVSGKVVDASGRRIAHAHLLVRAADANCRPLGPEVGAVSDGNGEFLAVAELDTVETFRGCVVVEAESGGTSGTGSVRVDMTPESPRVRVDVRLDRKQALTADEASRLVQKLAVAINEPQQAAADLSLYVLHGPEALRVALEQYRTVLGRVTSIQPVPSEQFDPRRFTFELRGEGERSARVDVYQEELTRMHSGLLDYGFRAAAFMNAYLRAISTGDAERLSRVLNPDDVDFPVEKAREIIVGYRRRYRDTASIRAEFVGVDESRAALHWRLRGPGPTGEEVTEPIELGFGDGLIGMRGL